MRSQKNNKKLILKKLKHEFKKNDCMYACGHACFQCA